MPASNGLKHKKARGQAAAKLIDSLKYNLTCSIIMVNIKREVQADGAARIYKYIRRESGSEDEAKRRTRRSVSWRLLLWNPNRYPPQINIMLMEIWGSEWASACCCIIGSGHADCLIPAWSNKKVCQRWLHRSFEFHPQGDACSLRGFFTNFNFFLL